MFSTKFLSSLLLVLLASSVAAQNITQCMIYTQANIIASSQKGGVMAPFLAFQEERDTLCNTTTWTCHLGAEFDTAADAICSAHGGVKKYEDVEICETYLSLLQVDTGGIIPLFRDVPICIAPTPFCEASTTHQDILDVMNVCAELPAISNPNRRLADMGPPPPGLDFSSLPPGIKF